jgi:hypothetical protein
MMECPLVPAEVWQRPYDPAFAAVMKAIQHSVLHDDQCCTILCAGVVGSGKSSLGLHAYDIVSEGELKLDNVVMNTEGLARGTRLLKDAPGTFLNYDEGNVNRRNSTTRFNKAFIDLLFNIRGLNGILWINNPSVQQLDKSLVEDALINAYVFINENRRSYWWITRDRMLDLYRKYGDLSYDTLMAYGARYAEFEGWFKAFTKPFWGEYTALKRERMVEKVDDFSDEFGGGVTYSLRSGARKLQIHYNTLHKYLRLMMEDKSIRSNVMASSGRFRLTEDDLEVTRLYIERARALALNKKN